ncbi:hypothetical protein DVH24_008559 [Malus domestica]|uniref:Uncharacterized protein n=1 Tax=Malus domestica TaxID=3750 RepID=A0A498JJF4_MALDO|nr:hypothetical protein DVH24_008559 [Malus domestica]
MTDFPGLKMSSESEYHVQEQNFLCCYIVQKQYSCPEGYKSKKGTIVLPMLLEHGFTCGLDARIVDLEYTRIISDNLKIQTILENVSIVGLVCDDFGATENLVDNLKSKSTSNASMEALANNKTAFVNQDVGLHFQHKYAT